MNEQLSPQKPGFLDVEINPQTIPGKPRAPLMCGWSKAYRLQQHLRSGGNLDDKMSKKIFKQMENRLSKQKRRKII